MGFRPDNDMEDGVTPAEVPGTVTDPALFKKLCIAGMKKGARVVVETDGKNAIHLLLSANGERRPVPCWFRSLFQVRNPEQLAS
jgi:hypothetical protein